MKIDRASMGKGNDYEISNKTIRENVNFLKKNIGNVFSSNDRIIFDPATKTTTYDIVLIIQNGLISSIQKFFPHASELSVKETALNAEYKIVDKKELITIDSTIKNEILKRSIAEFNKT